MSPPGLGTKNCVPQAHPVGLARGLSSARARRIFQVEYLPCSCSAPEEPDRETGATPLARCARTN